MKPNIILLVADDLGYANVGFLNKFYRNTPHLDGLAEQATVFDQFYGAHLCTPCRASLMTGKYAWRFGLQNTIPAWGVNHLPDDIPTLPQLLKPQGYECHLVGKWHLGHSQKEHLPMAKGFDSHYGPYTMMVNYYKHTNQGVLDWHRNGKTSDDEGHATDLLTAMAIHKIKSTSKPMFMYLSYTAPHAPVQSPPIGKENAIRKNRMPKIYFRTLHRVIRQLDNAINLVVKAALEKDPNTYIFFLSDNGSPFNRSIAAPFTGRKGMLTEGGIRVPAFVYGPNVRSQVLRSPFHATDYFTTIAELAGCKVKTDGMSLMDNFDGKTEGRYEIYYNVGDFRKDAIRVGDYKLLASTKFSLYDVVQDPGEHRDIADKEPEITAKLRSKLMDLQKEAKPFIFSDKPDDKPTFWGPQDFTNQPVQAIMDTVVSQ